ncbi:hypothetical protein ES703_84736 [subsurface metagenome]
MAEQKAPPAPAKTDKDLALLLRHYQSLQLMLENNAADKAALQGPSRLIKTNSLKGAQDHAHHEAEFEERKANLEEKRHRLYDELRAFSVAIMDSLPVKGAWVKVGDYAVGKYYSSWGGGHYDLSVKKWSDTLPELYDQTYFP